MGLEGGDETLCKGLILLAGAPDTSPVKCAARSRFPTHGQNEYVEIAFSPARGEVAHARNANRGRYTFPENVSQAFMLPLSKPRLNQRIRWSDVP